MTKVVSMQAAIAAHVRDGDTVVIEGFTHLINFAAGHEIIRQGRKDLTLCRLTPDLIYDQMIAAGCAKKLVFSWAGNPGAGQAQAAGPEVPHASTKRANSATGTRSVTRRLAVSALSSQPSAMPQMTDSSGARASSSAMMR